MKSIFKKTLLAMMMVMTFCLFSSFDSKAAGTFTSATVSSYRDTNAVIAWGYTGSESYFHIYLSADGNNWSFKDWGMGSSESINSLSPATTYYVRIVAATSSTEGKGQVAYSNIFSFTTLPTEPSRPENVNQIGATANTISLSWSPVIGATGYEVAAYNSGNYSTLAVVGTNSAIVPNLPENTRLSLCVRAFAQSAGGVSYGDYSSIWNDYYTTPAKVPDLGITTYYDAINIAYFTASAVNANGYELCIYNNKGKKITDVTDTSSQVRVSNVKKGVFCKYRMRGYVNLANGGRAYGPWSKYKYFGIPSSSTGRAYTNKIKYSWKKVAGATKYTVYVSSKSSTTGYKKFKTLSSKKNSVTVTKCGKSKLKRHKTYYVKVVATGKSGKDKGTSSIYGYVTAYTR